MYIGVDVGGTKVLVAVLDAHGVMKESIRFPTPGNYHEFLDKLAENVATFTTKEFHAAGVGIPVVDFDRHHQRAHSFGNLPWRDVDIQADVEKILHCPIVVENDAKLGALSEAMLLKNEFQRVLYVTVSTGIGLGLVVNGQIDDNIGDAGGRLIIIEHRGKHVSWESIASGKAIVKRFGKPARDINDAATWHTISRNLAIGLVELIALTEPEVIVFGGSVGTYFEKFKESLSYELKRYETPLLNFPVLRGAQRPEEAVIYGCYDLAKATYGATYATAP